MLAEHGQAFLHVRERRPIALASLGEAAAEAENERPPLIVSSVEAILAVMAEFQNGS
jgi:hypothetical protein